MMQHLLAFGKLISHYYRYMIFKTIFRTTLYPTCMTWFQLLLSGIT